MSSTRSARRLLATITVTLVVAFLAACGDGEAGEESPTPTPPAPTATPTTAAEPAELPGTGLFLIPAPGGAFGVLSDELLRADGLAWTPDGKSLLVLSETREEGPSLFLVGAEDGYTTRVADISNYVPYVSHLAVLPDGSAAIFECLTVEGPPGLCSVPLPAVLPPGLVRPTELALRDLDRPVLSADGSRVLFSSTRGDPDFRWGLWIGPVDGGEPSLLTNLRSDFPIAAAFSPDGGTVAFRVASFAAGEEPAEDVLRADIYLVGADGEGLRPLAETPEVEGDPLWSPDGREVAFLRAMGDQLQVVRVDVATAAETVVAQLAAAEVVGPETLPMYAPELTTLLWHPDGQRLTLVARPRWPSAGRAGLVSILDVGLDGTVRPFASACREVVGGDGPTCYVAVAWSPGGNALAVLVGFVGD